MSHRENNDWKAVMPNYYGFKHNKVKKMLEGDLTYIGTFPIKNASVPVAVYHNAKPNRDKGHKDYLLLFVRHDHLIDTGDVCVAGMSQEEMDKERFHTALHCLKCNDIVYSMYRHNYQECYCRECAIDGGKDYVRTTGPSHSYKLYTIDFLLGGKVVKKQKYQEDINDNED